MFNYTLRRILLAIPTLLFIALIIFLLLELSPGDPMAEMPLTIPPEVREQMRLALGLGEPWFVRFYKWLYMFTIVEPSHMLANMTGIESLAVEGQRIISFQTRSPVADIIAQRLPQTLWVVGLSYIFGILIAVPIGTLLGLWFVRIRPALAEMIHFLLFVAVLVYQYFPLVYL